VTDQLRPSDLPTDYRGAFRSVAYLLRAFRRVVSGELRDDGKDHRRRELPRELTDAIEGEHAPGDTCAVWMTKLARRWDCALSGDSDGYALRVFFPEGWARWEVVASRVTATQLDRIVECADLLASFAVRSGPIPGDADAEVEAEIDEAVLSAVAEPAAPLDPWAPPPLDAGAIEPARWWSLWRAEGAFAHGADERSGNVVGIRRAPVICPLTGEAGEAAMLGGNSGRGLARRVLMGDLAQRLGFDWTAARPSVAQSLVAGGTLTGSQQIVDVDMRRRLRALLPPIDLYGCNWNRTDTLGGWLVWEAAMLVCRETAGMFARHLAPGADSVTWQRRLRPSAEHVSPIQITSQQEEIEENGSKVLARVEVVSAGSVFFHRVGLHGRSAYGEAPEVVASCLAHLLNLMRERGAVGAANARGMGRVVIDAYAPSATAKPLPSPDAYLDHLAKHRDAILATVLADAKVHRVPVAIGPVAVSAAAPEAKEKPAKGRKAKAAGKASEIEPPAEAPSLFGMEP